MPVLEAADTQLPRSALRHRPLTNVPKQKKVTTEAHPVVQRASRPRPRPADDELVNEWQRADTADVEAPSRSRRTSQPAAQRERGKAAPKTTTRRPTGFRAHPLLLLGLGMLAMLALWSALNAGLNWWNDTMNYVHYGYPRTYQIDAVVGHTDSASNPSHFLVTNLHGRIEIIEFPGGDGSHARIYLGPQLFGPDADKTPVTLTFADVNGDHKADMLVFFQSSWIVLINDQGSFRTPTPQERQDATAYLAAHGQ